MESGNPEGTRAGTLPEGYVKKAIQFVVNAHAATVNMHLYPPTSSMVLETMEKAREWIDQLVAETGIFRVSALENGLLVNDIRLEDVDQQKGPVRSFVSWMTERGLSSLEFTEGVTDDEIKDLFELLSDVERQDMEATLADDLVERGVTHVTVNQRVYVAVTAGENGEFSRVSSPLDALKDELLIRYLMGKVELNDVEDRELMDVLSDPGKVAGLLSRFLAEEGAEGGVFFKSQKAEEALQKLSMMIGDVEDESLRETLGDQVTSIISEMTPREMMSVLAGHGPENLDIRHVRQNVMKMLSNNQLLDIVDSLIDEYVEMSGETDELETTWTRERLQDLNDVLIEVRKGERGEALAETIDKKLDEAGISEERDATTGTRVLSAHQMLGGSLDEADVPDLGEGVDKTASRQIKQLYAMGEDDLASGMLMRIADNLTSGSDRVRRYAALLLRESLEGLDDKGVALASNAIVQVLFEAAEKEQDYDAFSQMSDALASIARSELKLGMGRQISMIIEFFKRQSSEEAGKGAELQKHSAMLLSSITEPGDLFDPVELLAETDQEKFSKMVSVLASLGPQALSPIVDQVKDRGQVELREKALDAFRLAGPAGTQSLVMELEKENQWYVYRNVLNIIAELRAADALESIYKMVGNSDERIRREAVRTMARIGSRESVPWVQQAASDPSPAVRKTAVRVMGMFNDASVAPFLLDIVGGQGSRGKEEDQGVVEAAVLAIGDLRVDVYVPQLAELLGKGGLFRKGKPDEIRAAACVALGNIGSAAAVPVLQRALKDPAPIVRAAADRALERVSGEPEPIRKPEPAMSQPLAAAAASESWDRRQPEAHPVQTVQPQWEPQIPQLEELPPEKQSWQEPLPPVDEHAELQPLGQMPQPEAAVEEVMEEPAEEAVKETLAPEKQSWQEPLPPLETASEQIRPLGEPALPSFEPPMETASQERQTWQEPLPQDEMDEIDELPPPLPPPPADDED